jgi:parallel beta-helix repeat protein
VIEVTHDDTMITQSCVVQIPAGRVIPDTNTNGVLHLAADDITVRFAPGSALRGTGPETPWDQLAGIGIRVQNYRGITLVEARVHGYFNGLVASQADGFEIAGGDFSDNYRQRLRSTPQAEDGGDWLFPHNNDEVKWRDQYGGALCLEASDRVTVREVRVRRGQNGIVLDRVNDSRVFDNDASFLSGWGLALWRSSRNVISRNASTLCARHVEGCTTRNSGLISSAKIGVRR